MGHRFSKSAANNIATSTTAGQKEEPATRTNNTLQQQQELTQAFSTTTTTHRIPIPNGGNNNFVGPTINLQIQESPTAATCNTSSTTAAVGGGGGILQQSSLGCSNSSSLTSVNNLSCGRQIIIKIQLAKMENGNEITATSSTPTTSSLSFVQQQDNFLENFTADCNLNSSELMTTTTATSTNGTQRTAGSFSTPSTSTLTTNNNYLNPSVRSTNFSSSSSVDTAARASTSSSTMALTERLGRLNTLQFNDEIVEQNIGEIVEYCEVLEDQSQSVLSNSAANVQQTLAINEEPELETVCCRRKSKSLAANGIATSSTSKRRCRKCSCRDAFRRILEPSLSRSSNKANKQLQQERKDQKQQNKAHERHSMHNPESNRSIIHPQQQMQRNSMHSTLVATPATATFVVPSGAGVPTTAPVWGTATTTHGSDVIIPLATQPQFVVVQCAIVNSTPTTTSATTNSNLPNSIISITHNPSSSTVASSSNSSTSNDIMVTVPHPSTRSTPPPNAPIVHSQVDFVHYLVPDLERITNSSFYWGKMDRYEAERLLEGKPEGTFLLRDSAQEEFLFSVTFRKYGRSLHARIEQSGHRFSFDCHDPCVYTAATVTGLLEHYKDPACVMFFEPMLTIPLHRKNCFSLQQQCRATIVSNTTYDGINELELPTRLKSYLKEYHYKQKLRVKSNEPTYTIHCK